MNPPRINILVGTLIRDSTLDAAYAWLTDKGKEPNISNRQWSTLKPQLKEQLASGEYSFSVQTRVQRDGEIYDLWADQDRIVLKALTLTLESELKEYVSQRCFHIGGHGGAKAAVRETRQYLENNPDSWVMQSDVTGYYAQIEHHTLYSQLEELLPNEKYILRLLWQYMNRVVYDNGNYIDVDKGISLGCSLSPLLAALYLHPLDTILEESGGFYARFMDDWVLIVPTRWQLRGAVKETNVCLSSLSLDKHPEKTFIGRSGKDFDFLGYHLKPHGLTVSERSIQRRDEKIVRLYEQGADSDRVGQYVTRWQKWARAGVGVLAKSAKATPMAVVACGIGAPAFAGPYDFDVDGTTDLNMVIVNTTSCVGFFLNPPIVISYNAAFNSAGVNIGWRGPGTGWGTFSATASGGGVYIVTITSCDVFSFTPVNSLPTLTIFSGVLATTNEGTEAEITLTGLQAQGDEADFEDGTVSKFVIKAVSTGTLNIGDSAGAATPYATGTNDTVDATNKAYWTPAANASGTLNAFTVVAEDSDNAESTPAVQGTVTVNAVNDAPTFTGTPTIAGTAKVGQSLGLTDTGTNDIEGDTVSLSYQWKADGADITGAVSATYAVTGTEKGKTVSCTIIADDSNGGITTFTTSGLLVSGFSWNMFFPALVSPNK